MPYPKGPRQEDPNSDVRTTVAPVPGIAQVKPLPSVSTRGGAPALKTQTVGEIAIPNLPSPIAKLVGQPTGMAQSVSAPDRDIAQLVNRVVNATPLAEIGKTYGPFVEQMKLALQNRYADKTPEKQSAWDRMFQSMPVEMAQLVTRQLFDRAKRPELPAPSGRVAGYMQGVDQEHQRQARRKAGTNG